jgi:hypothetical protein
VGIAKVSVEEEVVIVSVELEGVIVNGPREEDWMLGGRYKPPDGISIPFAYTLTSPKLPIG